MKAKWCNDVLSAYQCNDDGNGRNEENDDDDNDDENMNYNEKYISIYE